jgi:hypothetical protein
MIPSREESLPQEWKGIFRPGGVLFLLSGGGGIVAWRLAAHLYSPSYPANAAAYLQLVAGKQLLANILWWNWIVGDLVLIVPSLAMYFALRRDHKILALVGSLISFLYIFYDMSVTELNSLTLVGLSQGYALAATDALKAAYLAAAQYGYSALPYQTVLSFGIGAIGWLLWSLAMLSGDTFPRWVAISGIVINGIGIIGCVSPVVPASFFLGLLQYFTAPLTAIWFVILGILLYRYRTRLS